MYARLCFHLWCGQPQLRCIQDILEPNIFACGNDFRLSCEARQFCTDCTSFTPGLHRPRQCTPMPKSQRTKIGLIHGYVHTEVHVHHHNCRWVPTPNVQWRTMRNVLKAVRDALAHAVWPVGLGVWKGTRQQPGGWAHPRGPWIRAWCMNTSPIVWSQMRADQLFTQLGKHGAKLCFVPPINESYDF